MVGASLSNKNRIVKSFLPLLIALFMIMLSACAPYQARKHGGTYHSQGIASWYGPGFYGHKTASGEKFTAKGLTAAHKTLPFGTMLRVTNIDNGRSVVVRVNDRGPFVRNRIIDLSKSAAEKIGMMGTGTARVEVATLSDKHRKVIKEESPVAEELKRPLRLGRKPSKVQPEATAETESDGTAVIANKIDETNNELAEPKSAPSNHPVEGGDPGEEEQKSGF